MRESRMQRVADQFQQEIATIIHQELKHPGVGFITITRVELSNDLRYAKVLFSCLGSPEQLAESEEALRQSAGFIRGLLKKRFRLKIIPMLGFVYDASIAGSLAMSKTLDELRRQDDGSTGN